MNNGNVINSTITTRWGMDRSANQSEEKTVQRISAVPQASPLLALPNEILLKISSYLSFVECTQLALASRRLCAVFNTEERLKILSDHYYGPQSVGKISGKNITNREIPAVPEHEISNPLLRLAYHRYVSNKYLASLGTDTSQTCVVTLDGHTDGVASIVPLPGERLVSSSWDKTIKVWNLNRLDGQPLTLNENMGDEWMIIPLLDGRLASCSSDKTVKVWDLSKPDGQRCVVRLYGHVGLVMCIAQLPDGRLVTGSTDWTLMVWDLGKPDTQRCVAMLRGHAGSVRSVTVLSSGHLASCSLDLTVKIWNLDRLQCVATLKAVDIKFTCVNSITELADGRLAVSYGMVIKVWDLSMPDGRQCVATLSGHTKHVLSVTALADGRLVSCSYDKTIKVWDPSKPDKEQCVASLIGHCLRVEWVLELDNGWLVSCSNDHKIKLWNLGSNFGWVAHRAKFRHDNDR